MSEETRDPLDGFNAADEKQVTKRKRKEAQVQEQRLADLKAVLSTPEGRRFVWRQLAGVYRLSFTPDPYVTAFNEGVKSPGLHLTAEITTEFPELYLLMQDEAIQAAKKEKANG